jgi:hypothetical protein
MGVCNFSSNNWQSHFSIFRRTKTYYKNKRNAREGRHPVPGRRHRGGRRPGQTPATRFVFQNILFNQKLKINKTKNTLKNIKKIIFLK